MNSSPSTQGQKPKPQEDVDFLVDNIQGQNAKAVLGLHGSRGTVIVECALGHFRKDLGHGINALFHRHFTHTQNIGTIGKKL